MPLNLNDPDDPSIPEESGQGPILHEPGEARSRVPLKLIISGAGALLVIVGLLIVWKSGLFSSRDRGETQAQPAVQPEEPKATTENPPAPASQEQVRPHLPMSPAPVLGTPSNTSSKTASIGPSNAESRAARTGSYTIYVSRQKIHAVADEESGRWKAAGYESSVTEDGGWFKVSVGRYQNWEEAKAAAIGLQDGFESGYRIARIEE